MWRRVLSCGLLVSLAVVAHGSPSTWGHKRVEDFLPPPEKDGPAEATYLTLGPEVLAPEAGERGFVPLFLSAVIPGGDVDTSYSDTVDLLVYESIANGSANVYPGYIPDTLSPQTTIVLADGDTVLWVRDDEAEELVFVAVPRDTVKPSIPTVLTINPAGDSATRLSLEGNLEPIAGSDFPNRYLVKAVDDSGLIVPSYTGFIDPTRRAILTLHESNPNGSAYLADFFEEQYGQSISSYLISGMANVFLFDDEPETLMLVATTTLADLVPDTITLTVLPSDETRNLLLMSMTGTYGTVDVEKNLFGLAFNFNSEAPDVSNSTSQVELTVNDITGTQSASISPATPTTMTSGVAQFKLLDSEADSAVIVEMRSLGSPTLYPIFTDKIAYAFKSPGMAIMAKVSVPTTCVVGDTATVTIYAVDGSDSLDTGYRGWIRVDADEEFDNESSSWLEYGTGVPLRMVQIRHGVGKIWLTDMEEEEVRIMLEDAEGEFPSGAYLGMGSPEELAVISFEHSGSAATTWAVELPRTATAGVSQTGTVKAVDDSGYVDPTFSDTARLSVTGNAVLADTLLPLSNGVTTFTVVDDSVEDAVVSAHNGGLSPGEDTVTFVSRGSAAYLLALAASNFLVGGELNVAVFSMSPEFEFDDSWNGTARLQITDPGAPSVTATQGNLDSIPIVNGVGTISLTDSEVEEFNVRTVWVSGDPPLQSPALESVESEVKLIVTLPESAFAGGDFDTILFRTLDGHNSPYSYDTWVSLWWEESNPNWSVIFSGPPDSVPIIGGTATLGIENTEEESVTVHVFTVDPLIADRSSLVGSVYFSSVGVLESPPADRRSHTLVSCGPNPFSGSTSISYIVGGRDPVSVQLDIYDAAGRVVRRLVKAHLPPGFYGALWNGDDDGGGRVGSGVYFYRLKVGEKTFTRKAVLLR